MMQLMFSEGSFQMNDIGIDDYKINEGYWGKEGVFPVNIYYIVEAELINPIALSAFRNNLYINRGVNWLRA